MLIEAVPVELDGGRVRLRWAERALPQISYEGGRPALASYLPWSRPAPLEASVGAQRVAGGSERLFLACSDGIGSDEECLLGAGPDGRMWKEVQRPLAHLLERLAGAWPELRVSPDVEERLTSVLEATLAELLADGALEDDATVGALLMCPNGKQPQGVRA
jgi:hypothetical protein